MKQIKAPGPLNFDASCPSVFLAGSIENGHADDWQTIVTNALSDLDITALNPRRDEWDASWRQSIDCPSFRQQVEWELDAQEKADLIGFYFSPATQAPITLLELGLAAARKRTIVCCPDAFWRKGNVDIVCARYSIPQVATLADLVTWIRREVGSGCALPGCVKLTSQR